MGLYLTPCIISAHLPRNQGPLCLTLCINSAHLPRNQGIVCLTPYIISAHLPRSHRTVYLTPCMISAHPPRIQESRKCLLGEKYTRFHHTRGSLSFVMCQAPLLPVCLTPCIISAHLPRNQGPQYDPLYHFSPSAQEPRD